MLKTKPKLTSAKVSTAALVLIQTRRGYCKCNFVGWTVGGRDKESEGLAVERSLQFEFDGHVALLELADEV